MLLWQQGNILLEKDGMNDEKINDYFHNSVYISLGGGSWTHDE